MSEPLEIKNFSLADDNRVEDKRLPGLCRTILNFVPNLGDGERIRPGYLTYDSISAPLGKQVLKIVPIQNPSQEDVHFFFTNASTQKIWMNPNWIGSSKQSTSIDIAETLAPAFSSSHVSYPAANQMSVTNWSSYSSVTTDDYYNGWLVKNSTQTLYSLVTDFAISANVATFTFYENLFTDIISNAGFETYVGTPDDATTDTFTGWTNATAGTGKVEASATANAGSASVKLTGDAVNTASVSQTITVNQNHTLSFYTRGGSSGSNKLKVTLQNPTNNRYYEFSGDNWQVAAASKTFNVSTSFAQFTESIELAALQTQYTITFSAEDSAVPVYVDTVAVSAISTGWASTDTLVFYRNFHDNPGFLPAYNNDKANPPVVKSDNSFIWLCGGQGSAAGNVALKVYPRLNRTFFPVAKTFTFDSTYVTERRLYAYDFKSTASTPLDFGAESTNPVPTGKTYWLGVAGVFDGFQLGNIKKYETYTDYTGGASTNNYIGSGNYKLNFKVAVAVSTLDKRLTGLAVYVATDNGDTRTVGRQTPYRFVRLLPFTDTSYASWAYTGGTTQKFLQTVALDKLALDGAGNSYQTDSGIADNSPDISYSHSTHEIISGRHFLANCYVSSSAVVDRQNLFTNPIGANAVIGNSGIPAVDMFSNDASAYVIRTTQGVGSKIQAIRSSDINSMIVWKDKGVLFGRVVTDEDGIPDIAWSTISDEVGLTAVDEVVRDDDEYHYFPDKNDIYRIRGQRLERLIERQDKNDWLNTYRNVITATEKANACVFRLPYLRGIVFCFGANRTAATEGFNEMQYIYFPENGWRQIRFGESENKSKLSFKWATQLIDGTVICTTTALAIMKFSATTFNDNGTDIIPRIDSGYFHPSGTPHRDWFHDKLVVSRKYDQPVQGSLDIQVYARETTDDTLVRAFENQDKTFFHLALNGKSDDRRIYNYLRFVYNSNLLNPERLNQGELLHINRFLLYGETRPRSLRVAESASLTQGIIMNMGNTIDGKRELLITAANTDEVFYWDTAFTGEYTDENGSTVPVYRFIVESAVTTGGSPLAKEDVTITAKGLTSITLQSTSANTVVTFMAG